MDGDEGDYISMDPSDENDNIATFKIDMSKPDGTDWKYETTYGDHDYSYDDEHARILLLGYENKNYLELREQCDQEEALEAAEKDRAPSISDVIINVVEGSSTNLKLENFPLSGNDQLAIKINEKMIVLNSRLIKQPNLAYWDIQKNHITDITLVMIISNLQT